MMQLSIGPIASEEGGTLEDVKLGYLEAHCYVILHCHMCALKHVFLYLKFVFVWFHYCKKLASMHLLGIVR